MKTQKPSESIFSHFGVKDSSPSFDFDSRDEGKKVLSYLKSGSLEPSLKSSGLKMFLHCFESSFWHSLMKTFTLPCN